MAFKIPFFPVNTDINAFGEFFRGIFRIWAGSDLIPNRVLDIGAWDMETNSSILIPLRDLTYKPVLLITATIYPDDDSNRRFLNINSNQIDENGILLTREDGSEFDSSDYSDTSINRGLVTLWIIR